MTDLQECRKEIDIIDKEILRLFEKRMKVCENVAEYKIHTGKKVLDPKREQDKITVLKDSAHGEFNELGAQELFQQIMAISRKRRCTAADRSQCSISGCRGRIQLCRHACIFF